ncbi:MAG: 23S rRNA (adenine(2503)-C(2))-methyltransferase RlmN [Treponema sp.]|nr:23S rRNA (adenine(2503)-C(2))-methyltransferase RlmN [Treponema sp.]
MGVSGLPREELVSLLPLPPYKAREVFAWIARGAESFDAMTNLGKNEREELSRRFSLRTTFCRTRLDDPDGTVKLHIILHDGAGIEAVLLRDREGRATACLSTQAGCPMGCVFCRTGALGFTRNLEAGEIVEQFLHLRRLEPEGPGHIVIMGMGEPLLNLGELRRALAVIMDKGGLGVSGRRITLSTSGLSREIRELADLGPPLSLALSLTSAREELRRALMPAAEGLRELKEALLYYQEKTELRLTLEAALFRGLNTGAEEARAFRRFARGLDVVVNLIPWNPVEGLMFRGAALREPAAAETETFARLLEGEGLRVTRRFRRGRGINGACGQLGSLPPRLR